MTFRPLHERAPTRRIEAAAYAAAGIIIPDMPQQKLQQGEIDSAGSTTGSEESF